MPARKGQGQWALGYREPLNPNERAKRDSDGLAVRQRIIDVYQHTGFAGIDPIDLRSRFRWFGLYTQRREGIPGGATATLEPEELEAEYFMLRVRIDGGALTSDQLRVDRRDLVHVRPRCCGHHRPAEHPAALDPGRGRARDLDEARGGRPVHDRGMWRHSARDAGLPARRRRDRLAPRCRRGPQRDGREVRRRPGVLQSAAQVQDVHLRLRAALHQPRDQRRVVRRCDRPGRHTRLRPVGGRRAVDEPDVRQAARCLRPPGRGQRGVGRRHRDLPRLRLPALAQPRPTEVPDGRLGPGKVPRGSRDRVPRPGPARRSRAARFACAP